AEAAEAGRHELPMWRAQTPFDRGEGFARRLEQDGLDETAPAAIPRTPVERRRGGGRPPFSWVGEPGQTWGAGPAPAAAGGTPGGHAIVPPGWLARAPAAAFLVAVAPLIDRARARLRARALQIPGPFAESRADQLFVDRLLVTFVMQLERVC